MTFGYRAMLGIPDVTSFWSVPYDVIVDITLAFEQFVTTRRVKDLWGTENGFITRVR